MKLREQFASDLEAEVSGVRVALDETSGVIVARWGNPQHEKILQELKKPYKHILRVGGKIPEEAQEEITAKSIARGILKGWWGIEDDNGEEIPFSEEKALEILMDPTLRDFRNKVSYLAMESETYRAYALQEAAKNSKARSDGKSSGASKSESS